MTNALRIKHWVGRNNVKIYNAQNVLRFETTINDPSTLRGLRHKQEAPSTAEKELLPLRKGVADTALRAFACQDVNDRLADHVAAAVCSESLADILETVTTPKRRRGRSIRGLEPTAKDLALLSAIADPAFALQGFRNRDLRVALADESRYRGKTEKQCSAMTTRSLRLLRDHGVIRRLPKAHRYRLTRRGRIFVNALQAALAASTEQLTTMAA